MQPLAVIPGSTRATLSAGVSAVVDVVVRQLPSVKSKPLMPAGLSIAARAGKKPDSE